MTAASLARVWRRLSPGARRLLAAVAMQDGALPAAVWSALAEPPEAVDELVAAGLVAEMPAGLGLPPTFPAAAVRAVAPWATRRWAHAALARHLARQPAQLEHAAHHAEAGGEADEAGRLWLAAARRACRAHRHTAAARAFGEALRLLPPETPEEELTAALGDFARCAVLSANAARARVLLQAWLERPAWRSLRRFQAEGGLALADLMVRAQRHVEAAETRRQAARELWAIGRSTEAAEAALAAAVGLAYALRFQAGREVAREAAGFARQAGRADLESRAVTVGGLVRGMLGETREGLAEVETALDLALARRLPGAAAEAYHLLGNVHDYASCYRDETAALSAALTFCRRHDETERAQLCLGCLAYAQFRAGQWKCAEGTLRQLLADPGAPAAARAVGDGVRGLLLVHRGEFRPALRALQASREESRRCGIAAMELITAFGLALHAAGTGKEETEAQVYRVTLEFWRGTEDRHDAIPALTLGATYFATRGDEDTAAEFAEALQRMAALTGNPEALGAAALAAGELRLLRNDAAAAAAEFANALAHYDRRELVVERVRGRLRLAAALERSGRADEADRERAEARREALRLGARPLAAEASSTGASPAPPAAAIGPWDLLSARQCEVARGLVAGRTNKEIAASLGVSVRTVDMHVAHVLERLDTRTRSEAAAKLASAAS